MKIIPIYKHKILSLPYEIVEKKLPTASKDELKVLIAVFSAEEFDPIELAGKLDITENAFRRALATWENAGILMLDGETSTVNSETKSDDESKTQPDTGVDIATEEAQPIKKEKKEKNVIVHTTLPQYSSAEIASFVENTNGCSELLDSCQQILGRIFNALDTSIIIGLIDRLSLSHEYILLLCSHAASVQKRSVRYVEKVAIDMYDHNIVDYAELESELTLIEQKRSLEFFVRDLFGIGKRALIKKEREFLNNWSSKFAFSRDMIRAAYEITVAKTGEASFNYANAILENWFASGFKTPDDVAKAEAERKNEHTSHEASFQTNDFYEAALMRSYENAEHNTTEVSE